MPLAMQAKMLRVLQEQAFERVGGNETIRTDVRLIAATHHDLKHDGLEGAISTRICIIDSAFLRSICRRCAVVATTCRLLGAVLPAAVQPRAGTHSRGDCPRGIERLCRYSWPGNVRELQSVLKQALLKTHGPILPANSLPHLADDESGQAPEAAEADGRTLEAFLQACLSGAEGDIYAEAHRQLDRLLLRRIIDENGGNQHQAARQLGIARETLRRRLRELGLQVTRHVSVDD